MECCGTRGLFAREAGRVADFRVIRLCRFMKNLTRQTGVEQGFTAWGETQEVVKRIRQPEKPPLLRQLDCKKLFTKSHLFVGIFWIGLRNVAAGGGTAARCGSLKVAAA